MNKSIPNPSESCAFIVTKPLQFMVAMSVVENIPKKIEKILIVIDSFFGAQDVAERINNSELGWKNVLFFSKAEEGIRYCTNKGFDSVFLHADLGVKKYFQLLLLKVVKRGVRIAVYEEGLGSYRTDLYSGLKKAVLKFFGIGVFFGDCFLTDDVYLYSPVEYLEKIKPKKNKTIKIKKSISNLILDHQKNFSYIFQISELNSLFECVADRSFCVIYLTGWIWEAKILEYFNIDGAYKVLKFHPHIKNLDKEMVEKFDVSVSPSVPAEILITLIANIFQKVDVIHHGSSIERYLSLGNVEFKRVS